IAMHDRCGGDDVFVGGEIHGVVLIRLRFARSARNVNNMRTRYPNSPRATTNRSVTILADFTLPSSRVQGIARIRLGTDPTGAARRPAAGVQDLRPRYLPSSRIVPNVVGRLEEEIGGSIFGASGSAGAFKPSVDGSEGVFGV